MATRRASSARPSRLVEGKTYNTDLPRQRILLARGRPLVSRQYQQSFTASGGQLVPVGEPHRASKQKLEVGSIVGLKSERRSRVPPALWNSADPAVQAFFKPLGPLAYNDPYSHRFLTRELWVVRSVSPCGKWLRVARLALIRDGALRYEYQPEGGVRINLVMPSQYRRDPVTGRQVYGSQDATVENVTRALRSDWASTDEASLGQALARASHVAEIFDIGQVPEVVVEAMRAKARQNVRRNLMAKLAGLTPAAQMLAAGQRNERREAFEAYVRRELQQYAKRARLHLKSANTLMALAREEAQSPLTREKAYRKLQSAWAEINAGGSYVRSVGSEAAANKMVERWAQRHGVPGLQRHDCGHFHEGASVLMVVDRYGTTHASCPECARGAVEVTLADGRTAQANPNNVAIYEWEDGTQRLTREPGAIGHRHSGKGVVGFVEPLVKRERESYLTVGVELEMQAYNGNTADNMARAMRKRLTASGLLDATAQRKWLHFEEDGSTGPGGFEMVTGYTDLPTQDKLLAAILNDDNGRPAWPGKLRSHDAQGGSCGIHVHITKPSTLIHASKLRYFINAAHNAKLVKDVARRYNDGYARINRNVCDDSPEIAAAKRVKQFVVRADSWSGRPTKIGPVTKQHVKLALDRLNEDNRYEALNFQNPHTVEFRIFRGSMLHGTVVACLEFTQAVWRFARVTPATSLTAERFCEFVSRPENRHETRHLRAMLAKKGWNVYQPKPKKVEGAKETETEPAPAGDETQPDTVNAPRLRRGVPVPHEQVEINVLNEVMETQARVEADRVAAQVRRSLPPAPRYNVDGPVREERTYNVRAGDTIAYHEPLPYNPASSAIYDMTATVRRWTAPVAGYFDAQRHTFNGVPVADLIAGGEAAVQRLRDMDAERRYREERREEQRERNRSWTFRPSRMWMDEATSWPLATTASTAPAQQVTLATIEQAVRTLSDVALNVRPSPVDPYDLNNDDISF